MLIGMQGAAEAPSEASEETREDGLPLRELRVLELGGLRAAMAGRHLGDLGADVVRVPFVGDRGGMQPDVDEYSSAIYNVNKEQIDLDLGTEVGRASLADLAGLADLLIEDTRPGVLARLGITRNDLAEQYPWLVVVSLTDFGQDGPYRDWIGSDATHQAMLGVLSRSGLSSRHPAILPGRLASHCGALQAALTCLLAYYARLTHGHGDLVDVSIFESNMQLFDPPYGISGTARVARNGEYPRGRPDALYNYPIVQCADGYVRVFVLSVKQWRSLRAWLGDPPEFTDPALENLFNRIDAGQMIFDVLSDHFLLRSREEIVEEGQRAGVALAPVLSPEEVLSTEHFAAREAFAPVELEGGATVRIPNGFLRVDGQRTGVRSQASEARGQIGIAVERWKSRGGASRTRVAAQSIRPLAGLRILDLGVMVVGAETSRILADQGAEVIKVENRDFPDGMRQAGMNASFARGHRNKSSIGLNLRSPEGRDLFHHLVAQCDILLSNFKPGTLESLGIGHEELQRLNPRIIVVESSALGTTGPWSRQGGFGPLMRAVTGLTSMWAYPDMNGGFCDSTTVFPDHNAARIAALGVLAALIRRENDGRGAWSVMAQAEAVIGQLTDAFVDRQLNDDGRRSGFGTGAPDAPRAVFPCEGDDEWCVIDVNSDEQWKALCVAIGRQDLLTDRHLGTSQGRLEMREVVEKDVAEWTRQRSPDAVATVLQAAGVAVGAMKRPHELSRDEHLLARGFFDTLEQPNIDEPVLLDKAPAHFGHVLDPEERPAPLLGEQTHEIARRLFGLSEEQVGDLLLTDVFQIP